MRSWLTPSLRQVRINSLWLSHLVDLCFHNTGSILSPFTHSAFHIPSQRNSTAWSVLQQYTGDQHPRVTTKDVGRREVEKEPPDHLGIVSSAPLYHGTLTLTPLSNPFPNLQTTTSDLHHRRLVFLHFCRLLQYMFSVWFASLKMF